MSKSGLVIILILLSGKNYAQQPNYFVLIQADNKQPFYVRLGSQSLSSSPEGSLILSQLKDSTYNITVGFPGQVSPEQAFSVDLHHKDQQFLLRNQAEKGWALYNPLTGEMRNSDPKEDKGVGLQPQGVKKDDAFSRLMAGVVRDTAVMYNTYAMEQVLQDSPATAAVRPGAPQRPTAGSSGSSTESPVMQTGSRPDTSAGTKVSTDLSGTRPDTGQTINSSNALPATTAAKTDSVIMIPDSGSAPPKSTVPISGSGSTVATGKDSSATIPPIGRPAIVKLSQRLLFRGLRLIYTDRSTGGKVDTIEIIIPPDTLAAARNRVVPGPTPAGTAANQSSAGTTVPPSGKTVHPADTSHRAAIRTSGPNSDAHDVQAPVIPVAGNAGETAKNRPDTVQKRPPVKTSLPFVNSDCHNFATDYDVDKLRVKMLESSKDEDRIQAARKVFKAKCFNTRQIRALSEVFTTDALKFRFFETAYPFAADDHFRELAGSLADPVYNSKFKAMTGQ
jgi:hypothetical protein